MGLLIAALLFGVGVVVLFRSMEIGNAGMGSLFWHRLQAYKVVEAPIEEEEELQASFVERVFKPFVSRLSKFLQKRTPEGRLVAIQAKLDMAGKPAGITPTGFLILRYTGGAVLAITFAFLASLLALGWLMALGGLV